MYDAALRQNNRDVSLMKKIGEAYIKTHAYNKAIKYYEAIVKAEPQSELRYYWISEIVSAYCDYL